jgi:hypothetical protein
MQASERPQVQMVTHPAELDGPVPTVRGVVARPGLPGAEVSGVRG